ncbi:MAG: F420-nonreducing hydrogenase [Coriobacteriia bacterium]|nr:F420-nonreducing hydrogenase [Coriobacteriia bacterium]
MSGNGPDRPTLATIVLGGCMGCHLSLLDAHEALLDLLGEVDLVHSPLTCGDELPACDVLLVEGAVGSAEDERRLREARGRATTLVALGTCAAHGGIAGLRNLSRLDDVLATAYGDGAPAGEGVPALAERVRPLSAVVDVDLEVPGCSPNTELVLHGVEAALGRREPDARRRNLCAECERVHETMLHPSREFVSDAVYALMELEAIDPGRCFLEQGVLCMGPMTREGCGVRCAKANVPCRGCAGPSRREFEQGGKAIDALAAVLPAGAIMFLDDLIGTGYRFTLPVSILPGLLGSAGGEPAREDAEDAEGGGLVA